jgi:hypothetical protein
MLSAHKIVAGCALGALIVLLCSSAAGCIATAQSKTQQASSSSETTQTDNYQAADKDTDNSLSSAINTLESHAWAAVGDAQKSMSIKDGKIVESTGQESYTSSYRLLSDSKSSCELTITRADGSDIQALLTLSGEEDDLRLSCEQLQVAFEWIVADAQDSAVRLTDVDEAYLELVDNNKAGLEEAVSAWCAVHVPAASKASFDGEVFLNTKDEYVSCTLTCNDAAKTVVSVRWTAGNFTVVS